MHRRLYRAVPGVTPAPCHRSRGFVLVGPAGEALGGRDGPGGSPRARRQVGRDSFGVSKLPGTSTSTAAPVTRTGSCMRGRVGLPEMTVPSRANWPSWQFHRNRAASGS
jgi:hypothetical protein